MTAASACACMAWLTSTRPRCVNVCSCVGRPPVDEMFLKCPPSPPLLLLLTFQGDLDMSGTLTGPDQPVIDNNFKYPYGTTEQFPQMEDTDMSVLTDSAHYYMECSNKGTCDRSTGECACFDGYDGVACQRASCPGSPKVCSGHGVCMSAKNLARADNNNRYSLWDKDITMGCKCDAGYYGPSCAQRSCKVGVDPLYLDDSATVKYSIYDFATLTTAPSVDTAEINGRYHTDDGVLLNDGTATGGRGTWAIRFFDSFGEDWITAPIYAGASCSKVVSALEALPNNVVPPGQTYCTRSWNIGQQDDTWQNSNGLAGTTAGSTLYDAQFPSTSAHPYKINYRMSIWDAYDTTISHQDISEGGLYTPLTNYAGSFSSQSPVVTSLAPALTSVNFFTTATYGYQEGMLLTRVTSLGVATNIGIVSRVNVATGSDLARTNTYTVTFVGPTISFAATDNVLGHVPIVSGVISATSVLNYESYTTTPGFQPGMTISVGAYNSQGAVSGPVKILGVTKTTTTSTPYVTTYTLTHTAIDSASTVGMSVVGFGSYSLSGVASASTTTTFTTTTGGISAGMLIFSNLGPVTASAGTAGASSTTLTIATATTGILANGMSIFWAGSTGAVTLSGCSLTAGVGTCTMSSAQTITAGTTIYASSAGGSAAMVASTAATGTPPTSYTITLTVHSPTQTIFVNAPFSAVSPAFTTANTAEVGVGMAGLNMVPLGVATGCAGVSPGMIMPTVATGAADFRVVQAVTTGSAQFVGQSADAYFEATLTVGTALTITQVYAGTVTTGMTVFVTGTSTGTLDPLYYTTLICTASLGVGTYSSSACTLSAAATVAGAAFLAGSAGNKASFSLTTSGTEVTISSLTGIVKTGTRIRKATGTGGLASTGLPNTRPGFDTLYCPTPLTTSAGGICYLGTAPGVAFTAGATATGFAPSAGKLLVVTTAATTGRVVSGMTISGAGITGSPTLLCPYLLGGPGSPYTSLGAAKMGYCTMSASQAIVPGTPILGTTTTASFTATLSSASATVTITAVAAGGPVVSGLIMGGSAAANGLGFYLQCANPIYPGSTGTCSMAGVVSSITAITGMSVTANTHPKTIGCTVYFDGLEFPYVTTTPVAFYPSFPGYTVTGAPVLPGASSSNVVTTKVAGFTPGMSLNCFGTCATSFVGVGGRTITGVNYDGDKYAITFSGALATFSNNDVISGSNVAAGIGETSRAVLTGYIYRLKFFGNPGKLKQPEIVTHLDGKRNSLMSVNFAVTSPGTSKDYKVITKVWTDGQQGESVDHFADHCDGVQVTIGNKFVSTDGSTISTTTTGGDTNKNTVAKFFLSSLTATEKALLKKCLGDSDFDTTNNKDVYNWDWGYDSTQGWDHPIRYPHLIKLVRSVTTYTDGGYYAAIYYIETDSLDSLGSGGTFYLLNPFSPPDAFSTDKYEVYTTKGTLALTSNTVAAEFGFASKTIYTVATAEDPRVQGTPANHTFNGDLSCEMGLSDLVKAGAWETANIKTLTTTVSPAPYICLNKTDIITFLNVDFPAMNPPHINLYTVQRLFKDVPRWSDYAKWGSYSANPQLATSYSRAAQGHAMTYMTNQISLDIATNWGVSASSSLKSNSLGALQTAGGLAENSIFKIYKFFPSAASDYNYAAECSNRGICNTATGVCGCFPGYTSDSCHVQSSLAL